MVSLPATDVASPDRSRRAAITMSEWLVSECFRTEASGDGVASQRSRGRDECSLTPYYADAAVAIYHADCRIILPRFKGFDLLLTDPPYGICADAKMKAVAGKQPGVAMARKRDYGDTNWDAEPVEEWVMFLARRLCKWAVIFGGNFYDLPPSSCWLIWDKEINGNFADCEMAWTNLEKAVRRIRHQWNGMLRKNDEPRFHPTQKPLDVMAWSLRQTPDEVQTVLDPWMGSGTTLRACKDAGKLCVGIEREERYCEIAAKRMSQEVLNFTPSEPHAADFGGVRSGRSSNTTEQETNDQAQVRR